MKNKENIKKKYDIKLYIYMYISINNYFNKKKFLIYDYKMY